MENTSTHQVSKSRPASFEELYAAKDFKGAVDYLIHNKQQFESGTFHYNLGTSYAKLTDYGAARFHLEKAIELGLYNSAVINNLNFIKQKIDVDDLSTSVSIIDQGIDLSLRAPKESYVTFTLALVLIFTLILKFKKVTNKIAITFALLIALLPIIFQLTIVSSLNPAIALKEVSVLEGPSKIFQEKNKLKPGAKVIVGEFKDGWFFIKYPIALSGWVQKDNLGIY